MGHVELSSPQGCGWQARHRFESTFLHRGSRSDRSPLGVRFMYYRHGGRQSDSIPQHYPLAPPMESHPHRWSTPVFVGFLVGARCLMGMLAGSVGAGAMMAIMMSNAGGAWDNSQKYIEIAQAHGGKGTEIHKACVVGDTVGDPFKDTSGPALNILLKLMAMVSLTIATLLRGQDDWELWYYAFIPLVIMIIATVLVMVFNYGNREDFVIEDDEPAPKPKPVVQAPVPVPVPEPVPVPVPVPVVPEPVV